ncbi:MAG TPA: nucleoside recognition domain-containing protein, partial [Clostridia bacterium]|nr:nucleoside recognition domain-containing protein [Clostridia bacterium]
FIKKAGTIILASSVLIWFLASFGTTDGAFGMVEDINTSILAVIGGFVAPLFSPLGFGNWQSTVATLMGLVAKEEVVGVFGVLYGVAGDALELVEEGAFGSLSAIAMHFTALSAYSFLVFNLLCAPCFAAIGAIRREMNSARWTWFAVGYQCTFAYAIALIVYQLGSLFTGNGFGMGTVVALALIALLIYLLARPNRALPQTARRIGMAA